MLFPTVQYAIFFAIVLVASWLLTPQPVRWKLFMLGASYVFYAAWDPRFLLLLAGVTVFNQVMALRIAAADDDDRRRALVRWTVAGDLAVLGWFKYYGFFVASMANLLARFGVSQPFPLLEIVLPVGISFFTFQAISYVVDIGRGKLEPASHLDVAVFLAFFPQLVAGPIVRAREFLPQLATRAGQVLDTGRAFGLITAGLFKKVVVASFLASAIVDEVFANPSAYSSGEILVAVYGYAAQIYTDFSGYTDIAIGCAMLLGFTFPDNFNRPYAATTLRDFWRRWHMTLSRWLRDYLYIPLGGSAHGRARTYRNLMLTMLLGGLWHGAAWTFVAWGALHGGWLALERYLEERRQARPAPRRPGLAPLEPWWIETRRWLVTFHVVCLGWVFFRADSFDVATTMLTRLATAPGPAPLVTVPVLAVIVATIAVQFLPEGTGEAIQAQFSRLPLAGQALALAGALVVIDALGPPGVAPFIYFQF